VSITPEHGLLIDGESVFTDDVVEVVNPATGEAFAAVPRADRALVDRAVAAAKAAFPAWAATPFAERVAVVHRMADALEQHADEVARLLTQEQGKPLSQAMDEVFGSAYMMRGLADNARMEPVVLKADGPSRIVEYRAPLGVVAAITPWNYPVSLLAVKVAPALVAGDTVVAKPAPTTPLTTVLLAQLWREIVPAGVLNVVCDVNDLGPALTEHPDVAKVSFTGSGATGKKVMASVAPTLKRLTLELGGNDPAIVLDDLTPTEAAAKVYDAAMLNAGQVCLDAKRIYVPRSMYDDFCDEIARLAKAAVVGDGLDPATTVGPIQNRAQFEKVKGYLQEAQELGKVLTGGAPLDRPGYFVPPTIVRDLPDDARLVAEEQFGPVVPVLAYDDVDEVIARANATDFGLGGTVWGRDTERAAAVAARIESGTVWVNQHLAADVDVPSRGAKWSGFGAELGLEGFHEYTQARVVNQIEWTSPAS